MKKLSIGLFLISFSWLFLEPIFCRPHWIWILFCIIGILFIVWEFKEIEINVGKNFYLSIIPIVVGIIFIPFHYNLSGIILLIGFILLLLAEYKDLDKIKKYLKAGSFGCFIGGIIFSLQSIILPFFKIFASRFHEISFINYPLVLIFNLFGLKTYLNDYTLIIDTGENPEFLYTSWENFGLFFVILFIIAASVILVISKRFMKNFPVLLISLSVYSIFRYIFLVFVFHFKSSVSIFWNPVIFFITFLPVIYIFYKSIPDFKFYFKNVEFCVAKLEFRTISIFVLSFFAVFFLTAYFGFNDPGVRKSGKILIDEKHSDWEWTEEKYDTKWYGQRSGYNFYNMTEYLKNFYHVEQKRNSLSDSLLQCYDILIIKTPTEVFEISEIRSIERFVRNGGGLYLIGDHTNVFGMNTFLNPIAERFGFRFKYNSNYDMNGSFVFFETSKVFPHPVIQNMPFFLFATGCTLEGPISSEKVMTAYYTKALDADYSTDNFFPRHEDNLTRAIYGYLDVVSGKKYGKGRVLLFTDSTVFSNFFMFFGGRPENLLGSIEWLNRINKYDYFNNVFLFLFIFLSIMAILLFKNNPNIDFNYLFFGSVIGFISAFILFTNLNMRYYRLPQEIKNYEKVCFEKEHSDFLLPDKIMTLENKNNFQTFLVWIQRLNIYPVVKYKFSDCLKDNEGLVIINPTKEFKKSEVSEYIKYIKNGGKVLIMDSPENKVVSTSYTLLKPFDMRIIFQNLPSDSLYNNNGQKVCNITNAGHIVGGDTVLYFKNGYNSSKRKLPVLSVKKLGKGMIAVFASSNTFSRVSMGATATIPKGNLKDLYELEYWLFSDLLKIGSREISNIGSFSESLENNN